MCLIIDANCASETLSSKPSDEFAPILQAILNKSAAINLGGKTLRTEYARLPSVWKFIVALDRAGKARLHSDDKIDNLTMTLAKSGLLKSNDAHIIALAQVSGARLLCSKDQVLHQDFRSKKLIDNPRGHVYQNQTHVSLLRKCCDI